MGLNEFRIRIASSFPAGGPYGLEYRSVLEAGTTPVHNASVPWTQSFKLKLFQYDAIQGDKCRGFFKSLFEEAV